ncbi:hypothetical protein [Aureivirga sp. CE67]|uniref:hypothetical protein n=1 Tax=Aureivirga sp. CE67 TaxID=1788983 RepID=UPI0018C98DB7|nr:hypothetical protein [Aureivirga sp. CE67]
MKNILLFTSIFLISIYINAQVSSSLVEIENLDGKEIISKSNNFLYKHWSKGIIIFNDNTSLRTNKLKFDLQEQTICLESRFNKDNHYFKLDNKLITRFKIYIDSKKYFQKFVKIKSSKFNNLKDRKNIYYESFSKDYIMNPILIQELNTQKMKYFFLKNGKYHEIELSEKEILKMFKTKKEVIQNYIKKNNLNCENVEHFIRILNFIN